MSALLEEAGPVVVRWGPVPYESFDRARCADVEGGRLLVKKPFARAKFFHGYWNGRVVCACQKMGPVVEGLEAFYRKRCADRARLGVVQP